MMAFFEGAKIEKTEVQRFLDLENKRRRNEDPGNVGLHRADFTWPMRIRRGRFKKIDEFPGLSILHKRWPPLCET